LRSNSGIERTRWAVVQSEFGKRWFLLALTLVVLASVLAPEALLPLAERVDVRLVVIAILFLMSATLETSALVAALKQPAMVGLGVALGYVWVPAFGWASSFGLNRLTEDFGVGILIMCAMPCTLASATIWTRLAGGNDALSLLITVVSNGVSFLVSPLILYVTLGQSARLSPGDMIGKLFVTVVLPVVAGQLLRFWRPAAKAADNGKGFLSVVTRGLILSVIFSGLVKASLELRKSAGQVTYLDIAFLLLAVGAIHLLAVAGCWFVCRLLRVSRSDRLAILFAGSQKTLPAGLYVAAHFFGRFPLASIPILFYHAAQLVLDTYLADWARERGVKDP
jgi:sodium/bile acid cotransporter 7